MAPSKGQDHFPQAVELHAHIRNRPIMPGPADRTVYVNHVNRGANLAVAALVPIGEVADGWSWTGAHMGSMRAYIAGPDQRGAHQTWRIHVRERFLCLLASLVASPFLLSCAAGVGDPEGVESGAMTRAVAASSAFPSMFLRGTFNSWGVQPMQLVSDHLWSGKAVWSATSGNCFKFDAHGDWQINFGDNNRDFIADRSGRNICVGQGRGEYDITFNEKTRAYKIVRRAALPAPTGLRIMEAGSAFLVVIWDDMPEVTGYQREWNGVVDLTLEPYPERYANYDLEPSSIYKVRVRARYGRTWGSWSEVFNATTLPPSLDAPEDVVVLPGEDEVAIRWTSSLPFQDGLGFEVQRAENVAGPFARIMDVPAADGVADYAVGDPNVVAGRKYFYKVRMKRCLHWPDSAVEKSPFTETLPGHLAGPAFVSTYPHLQVRGTFNAWGTTSMTLVADNTWQARIPLGSGTNHAFKFDVHANWATNFGDNNGDGVCERDGANIPITGAAGECTITFNDSSRTYRIESPAGSMPPR